MRYEQYGYRKEYDGIPRAYRGFAIIPQQFGDGMGVIIRQRNGKGESPYMFDLPGGTKIARDDSLAETAARETLHQICLGGDPATAIAVGSPLWLPIYRNGVLTGIDCAQAFLMDVGAELPESSEEALNVAVVNDRSAMGFSIVGLENESAPANRVFGPTPIMLWDGLSILNAPFYDGPDRDDLLERIGVYISEDMYLPVDNGNYLARRNGRNIQLFARLNPFEEHGRFFGTLEDFGRVY